MKDNKIRVAINWICVAIGIICLFWVFTSEGKLSDETLEMVDDLRWKHYGYGSCIGVYDVASNTIEWNRDFLSIWVEGDKLFVETQGGKWFIGMEKMEEEK